MAIGKSIMLVEDDDVDDDDDDDIVVALFMDPVSRILTV